MQLTVQVDVSHWPI